MLNVRDCCVLVEHLGGSSEFVTFHVRASAL